MQFKKKTSNNGTVEIIPIDKSLAKEICIEKHYSHKWNTAFGKINLGIFRENQDKCLGVAVFGNLMNPKSYSSIAEGLQQHEIVELNRLWVDDELKKNIETVFLSLCFKYIKRYHPEIKIIQSFADGRIGCGTIYKAANFKYYGFTKALFFEDAKDPNIIYHRALSVDTRRLSTYAIINLKLIRNEIKAFKVKSYRYLYFLDKKIHKSIKLKEKKYPSYEINKDYILNFKQPVTVMCRTYFAFKLANQDELANEVYKYILKNYKDMTIEEMKEEGMTDNMKLFFEDDTYKNKLKNGINKWLIKLDQENRQLVIS